MEIDMKKKAAILIVTLLSFVVIGSCIFGHLPNTYSIEYYFAQQLVNLADELLNRGLKEIGEGSTSKSFMQFSADTTFDGWDNTSDVLDSSGDVIGIQSFGNTSGLITLTTDVDLYDGSVDFTGTYTYSIIDATSSTGTTKTVNFTMNLNPLTFHNYTIKQTGSIIESGTISIETTYSDEFQSDLSDDPVKDEITRTFVLKGINVTISGGINISGGDSSALSIDYSKTRNNISGFTDETRDGTIGGSDIDFISTYKN
jgi:hypothetical protein